MGEEQAPSESQGNDPVELLKLKGIANFAINCY